MSAVTSLIIIAVVAVIIFLVIKFYRTGDDTAVSDTPKDNVRDDIQ